MIKATDIAADWLVAKQFDINAKGIATKVLKDFREKYNEFKFIRIRTKETITIYYKAR